ncbi:hypothetical protein [Halomonas campaniensis]|uniref:Uncharacterized protein n=1 Tax=Halomonas campaniensis TaxID=213554 RepID=A0A246RVW4_9GAMM|nr:hypothetical protein [Halomonas campaniensis]OWV28107.1 hypothetical protein JI62_17330 [Halomonas campaniensis]
MESIPINDVFAMAIAALAVIITLIKLFHSHFTFEKQHHCEKKNRLLDLASQWDNQYPSNHVDVGLMRNALYDFCNHRKVCFMMTIVCLNRPDSEQAIESLKHAGHLFIYHPKSKSIIRISSNKTLDIIKSTLIFTYYLVSIVSLWFLMFFKPESITLNTSNEIYAYTALLMILLIMTVHSFFELGRAGKKNRSIRYLRKMLDK